MGFLESNKAKAVITVVLIALAIVHHLWPEIDTLTLVLAAAAVLLWLLPPGVADRLQTLKIPGVEVTLRELKEAGEKITGNTGQGEAPLPVLTASGIGSTKEIYATDSAKPTGEETAAVVQVPTALDRDGDGQARPSTSVGPVPENAADELIEQWARQTFTPSLALFSLGKEVEAKLQVLGKKHKLNVEGIAPGMLLDILKSRGVFDDTEADGLTKLIRAADKATRAVLVEPAVATWTTRNGPIILAVLDRKIREADRTE